MDDSVFQFGDFKLDARQRCCWRRDGGQPVPLKPRAFDTLLYLVQHAGELVEKSTLLAALWPGTVVEENTLNKQISVVRRALGDENKYIVTVPGRGYQFIAPAYRVGMTAEPLRDLGSGAERASVAVLPFTNVTGSPGNDYLAVGLAEELINALVRVQGLKVPARTSSFAYRDRNVDVREIARELGVATVLEGSVRSAGARIRVTAQLVDGRSGYHLWSQAFDRERGDLFELQDELAKAIVQALRVELDRALPSIPSMVLPPTRDLEAYRLYLEGAALTASATIPDHERSRALMNKAIERDPEFAHAHMGLAFTQASGVFLGLLPLSCLGEAETAARRALALDGELAHAHAALAIIHSMRGKFVEAERGFRHARALHPGDPHIVHCHLFCVHEPVGRIQLAYEESLWVHRCAPAWVPGVLHLGVVALIAGRDPAEILHQIDIAVGLGFPRTRAPIPELLANLAIGSGNRTDACDYLQMELATADAVRDQRRSLRETLRAVANPDYKYAALQGLDQLQHQLSIDMPEQPSWIHLVLAYAQLGDLGRAFACANRALDVASRWNSIGAHWGLMWMPAMREFRADARFLALAERLGLTEFWKKCGPADADALPA